MFFSSFWKKFIQRLKFFSSMTALFLISFYRLFLSTFLACGGACRFYPSCSEYAELVYKNYPFLKATALTFKRILACHPFGPKIRDEKELWELKKR